MIRVIFDSIIPVIYLLNVPHWILHYDVILQIVFGALLFDLIVLIVLFLLPSDRIMVNISRVYKVTGFRNRLNFRLVLS